MVKKFSKTEAKKKIDFFFSNIKNKTPEEIKKIRRLAASQNISLGAKRKLFCKKCFSLYRNSKIRIKNNVKSVTCENCDYIARWKIK